MKYGDSLSEHFPEGPASRMEKKIDVVVATDSCTTVLSSYSFTILTETLGLVTAFLDQHSAKLRDYLRGPAQHEFWEAPLSVEDQTRLFINGLKIPMVNGNPVLLLHALGEDIVDPNHIKNLFPTWTK